MLVVEGKACTCVRGSVCWDVVDGRHGGMVVGDPVLAKELFLVCWSVAWVGAFGIFAGGSEDWIKNVLL